MKLSDKILALRRQRGLSQEEMAEKLGVSRQAVSRWEVGSALPDASNVLQLSKLLGVTADFLLNDEYESDRDVPAVKRTERAASDKVIKITALCAAAFGLFGNFIVYILSRFIEVPVPVMTYDQASGKRLYTWNGYTDYSYRYFVQEHNLELLTAILWLFVVVGLFAAFANRKKLRQAAAKLKENLLRKRGT